MMKTAGFNRIKWLIASIFMIITSILISLILNFKFERLVFLILCIVATVLLVIPIKENLFYRNKKNNILAIVVFSFLESLVLGTFHLPFTTYIKGFSFMSDFSQWIIYFTVIFAILLSIGLALGRNSQFISIYKFYLITLPVLCLLEFVLTMIVMQLIKGRTYQWLGGLIKINLVISFMISVYVFSILLCVAFIIFLLFLFNKFDYK